MPSLKYRVTLTSDEEEQLKALVRKGKRSARQQTRARILLKAAAGCQDDEIMQALSVSATMVAHARKRCVEEGVEAALRDRPRLGAAAKLTGKQCAHLIATAGTTWACALDAAPAGRSGGATGVCRLIQP